MNSKEITIYEPNQRLKIGFFKTWFVMFKNIINSRDLIYQLFRRDFLMSYKKSFLGMGWIFISPIIGIISWVVLNSTGVLNPGDVGIPYAPYVLLSSSIWGLFMGFYASASGTLDAGSGFINQVKYPHEALLVKQAAQQIAGFLINFVLNIVVLFIFGVVPSWGILLFPLVALPLFFLGAGIGLIISVVNVVASDISRIFNVLMGLLIYATPVIYSQDVESRLLRIVIQANPLTYLIDAARDIIIYGRIEYFERYLLVAVASFIFFMFAWRLFYVSEDEVIERMV
jgi:lipopolysaccharide transport system permease protein